MKSKICFIALLFVSTILGGQTFSFECFCGYLTAADNNCDICSSSIQSRLFKGLIIRYNGTAVAWMDAPYIVKFNANTATITEIVTSRPETFSVDLAGTTIPTLAEFKDSLQCPCNNATALGWTVSDTTQYELIYGDTLYFIGGGATIVQYDSVTNTVTITTPPGSADGSETIIQEGTGIDVTGTGTIADPYIITNTGDLSNTNELQTISANGAGPTSYTVDLSSGGGAVTLAEGTGIDLTRSTNTITIAATAAGTDLSYTGTSSPVTLNSSTGTDVTITAAGINTLSATSGNLTITGTEVDGSTSNEIQNITAGDGAGDNKTLDLSLGGGTVTLDPAGVFTLARTGNTLTMTATEVDGSTSNELQTYGHAGTTSYTNTLSNGGGSFTLQAAGIAAISHTTGTVTITATEVDGSTSNELQTYGHAGTTSYTNTLSNGGGSFTLQAAGINTISHSAGTTTITGTEVDGSTSNELQTISANGAGPTSYTVDLSNGGGAVTLAEGSGIDLTRSTNTITVANTGDLSTSNEIQAITAGDGAGDNKTLDLSLGGGTVTLDPAGVFTLARTGNTLTMTATEVDGSTSNELQTYGHAGTTSYTNTLSNGGGSFTLQAAGTNTISHSAGTTTITGTEVDGSTSNEIQAITAGDGTGDNKTLDLSLGGGTVTLDPAGIFTLARTGNTLTMTATEVDGSTSNELQTISANGAGPTSYTVDLSNGGGAVTLAEGSGIDLTRSTNTITVANTGDLSTSNEIQAITAGDGAGDNKTLDLSLGGGTVTLDPAGVFTLARTGNTLTMTATEVDGSTSNELQTYGHAGTTSYTNTLSNGGGSFTLQAAGIAAISHSAGTTTITATEVDGSTSNELQTISANGAGPTSYTVDLSSGGGAVTLAEGTGIDLTRSTNTITIAATAAGTDLSFTGTSSPVTLNSSTGADVTITAAGINTLSATSGNITITGTEVDGSTSNELQTYGHAGTTSYTNTLSNGGGSFTLQAAGIAAISHSAGTTTITATEVDGSTSNELQTISANGAGPTSYTVDLSSGGGAVTLAEGAGIDLTRSTNTITVANTGDLSTSNEIQAITAGDGTGDNKTLDLSLGGGTVTLDPAGVFTLARTGNTLTMTATEVDGSTSNELQTYGHAGTTSYTNTLSNGGGSFTLQAAGTNTISHSAGTTTITGTEVDGSTSNELQTYGHAGTTSYTNTLSNGGGSFTLQAAGIAAISHSAGTTTITATEVDGSTSNELQTISANGAGPTSYTVDLSSGGGAVTLAEGAGIDLTRSTNTITIASTATGTVTGAENGTNIVANKVRLGGNLITAATSIEGDGNELRFFDGKFSISSWTGFANSPVQVLRVQSLEGSPTTGTTPVSDGIAEFKVHNSSGSDQSNELTIGGYATDADGIWIQARSGGNPSFEYPLSLQPRGGQLSVGRLTGLDALVTFSGIGLAGSAAAGSVLLLENSEGNGKVSMGMGSGSDNLGSEVAWFPATDGIRLTNRGTTNGTSSIRFAIGGETSDVGMMTKTGATTLGRLGMGYTNTANVHSTIQSAGSLATGYLETVGSPTFDETLHTVIYTNSTNVTWAMPSAASCACAGREYVVHHAGTAGTLTLGVSVTKGNGGNFSTLSGGEWAHIFYGTSSVRGYKLTSL